MKIKSLTDEKVDLNQDNLNNSAETMRALSHPLRLKILAFIDNMNTTHVNKIYNSLNLEQSITSQHLRILREANLVIARRDGKYMYYTVNYDKIRDVNASVVNFLTRIAELEDK